jgi:hypothetical protein
MQATSNMLSICIESHLARISHIFCICGQSIYDEHSKYVLNIKQGRAQKTFKMTTVYEHYVSCISFIMCITYIQCLGQSNILKTFELHLK